MFASGDVQPYHVDDEEDGEEEESYEDYVPEIHFGDSGGVPGGRTLTIEIYGGASVS